MRDSTFVTRADVYNEVPNSPESVEVAGPSECVMVSGDSPPPMQAPLPLLDYDTTDEANPSKSNSPTQPLASLTEQLLQNETDTEAIEAATRVTENALPVPEPKPMMIERNGIETKKPISYADENSCIIDCIYYTQQCCECVIL